MGTLTVVASSLPQVRPFSKTPKPLNSAQGQCVLFVLLVLAVEVLGDVGFIEVYRVCRDSKAF